jgi:hypothetical protein
VPVPVWRTVMPPDHTSFAEGMLRRIYSFPRRFTRFEVAYRMSMNLRGWITEEDEQVTFGPDGRAIIIAVRGYNDSGDATENFNVDASGIAHWTTVVDAGSAAFANMRYNTYGGPWLSSEIDIKALIAAGEKASTCSQQATPPSPSALFSRSMAQGCQERQTRLRARLRLLTFTHVA